MESVTLIVAMAVFSVMAFAVVDSAKQHERTMQAINAYGEEH